MEQINPCRGIEKRPVGIPGKSKNVPIGHTLKFSKTSLLHTTNRCHIVTQDKNQGPSQAMLATRAQDTLQECRVEILATILRKGKGIIQIHFVPARTDDATDFPNVDGLLGGPTIGKNFVFMLGSPKLFTAGKPRWE